MYVQWEMQHYTFLLTLLAGCLGHTTPVLLIIPPRMSYQRQRSEVYKAGLSQICSGMSHNVPYIWHHIFEEHNFRGLAFSIFCGWVFNHKIIRSAKFWLFNICRQHSWEHPRPLGVLTKDIAWPVISTATIEVSCVLQSKKQQPARWRRGNHTMRTKGWNRKLRGSGT